MRSIQGEAPLRVLIVDDHFIVREGLRFILEGEPDITLVGEAADGAMAVRLSEELAPQVVLMDVRMPGMDGLEAIEQIRRRCPQVAVVILTTYDDDAWMLQGLRAGASGYLLKDVDRTTLLYTMYAAARGEALLSSNLLARLVEGAPASSLSPHSSTQKSRQANSPVLTQREQAVLEAVARGERNKEIAANLGISEPTVKTHLVNLYTKLDVDSRASAVASAVALGLLSLTRKSQF
ncbi:MAG TPA: response regulator transcription factor [Ktedonobacteraceae bacterium]|nr:response regulator transcription factor [Ktedonobacteraceae bacterium]